MRVGISTWSLPWAIGLSGERPAWPLDVVDVMRRAVDLGVHAVQFADNLPLESAPTQAVDTVQELAAEHDIAVEIGTRGIDLGLLDCLATARRFGAGFVRVVVDRAGDHPAPSEMIRRLSGYESAFRTAGVRLAIENHDRIRCTELATIVTALGDWTGVCLDTVNSLGALEPPDRVVEVLAPLTINLHVKDFVIRRMASGLGFEVVGAPVGAGMLDVAGVVRSVADVDPGVNAIIELWTPPCARIKDTIAKEADWLEQSVAYLTTLPMLASRTPA